MIAADFISLDISQQWFLMACILTIYFLKDKLFDEVALAKFFAQRRVAKSNSQRAVSTSYALDCWKRENLIIFLGGKNYFCFPFGRL